MRKGNRRSPKRVRRPMRGIPAAHPGPTAREALGNPFETAPCVQLVRPELRDHVTELMRRSFAGPDSPVDGATKQFVLANLAVAGLGALDASRESLRTINDCVPPQYANSQVAVMLNAVSLAVALGVNRASLGQLQVTNTDGFKAFLELLETLMSEASYDLSRDEAATSAAASH